MEEKIIIKSERYDIKKFFKISSIVGATAGLCVGLSFFYDEYLFAIQNRWLSEEQLWKCNNYSSPFEMAWENFFQYEFLTITTIVLACIAVLYLVYIWLNKVELTVTDKRVYGRAAFGKRVDLPIDSVSAIGTSLFKGISVATSSGVIKFAVIKNRDEIHSAVSKLLMERQGKPAVTTTNKQEVPKSNAQELKEFKELLDCGVISQEEFDAKKKQLLGL